MPPHFRQGDPARAAEGKQLFPRDVRRIALHRRVQAQRLFAGQHIDAAAVEPRGHVVHGAQAHPRVLGIHREHGHRHHQHRIVGHGRRALFGEMSLQEEPQADRRQQRDACQQSNPQEAPLALRLQHRADDFLAGIRHRIRGSAFLGTVDRPRGHCHRLVAISAFGVAMRRVRVEDGDRSRVLLDIAWRGGNLLGSVSILRVDAPCVDFGVGRGGHLPDRRHPAVPEPGQGADHSLLAAAVVKRLARAQQCLRNDRITRVDLAPDGRDQFVAPHRTVAMLDQVDQALQRSWAQRNPMPVAQEFPSRWIELEFPE